MSRRTGIILANNDGLDRLAFQLLECAIHQFTPHKLGMAKIPFGELSPGVSGHRCTRPASRGPS